MAAGFELNSLKIKDRFNAQVVIKSTLSRCAYVSVPYKEKEI